MFLNKDKTEIKKKALKPPKYNPDQKVRFPKSKGKYFYILPVIFVSLALMFGFYLIFFAKKIEIWSLLVLILLFPMFILSGMIFSGKLFRDRHKIKKKLIPVVTSNFIILNFLTNTMRIYKMIGLINSDGLSTDIGNRTYIVDKKSIWFDEKNRPNSFYLPEIPNPLKFSANKIIENFLQAIRENNPNSSVDYEGEIVDISFSSTNLQLFKKNKIFDELNKNPNADKLQFGLIGIIVFILIILLIAIILN